MSTSGPSGPLVFQFINHNYILFFLKMLSVNYICILMEESDLGSYCL